jgi:hypothetical protein
MKTFADFADEPICENLRYLRIKNLCFVCAYLWPNIFQPSRRADTKRNQVNVFLVPKAQPEISQTRSVWKLRQNSSRTERTAEDIDISNCLFLLRLIREHANTDGQQQPTAFS